MSIVACVKVYDGIVLGAESMSQLSVQIIPGQPQLVKAYANARKLFQIYNLPFGVLTYGAGNIGQRSIESFLYEFNEQLRRRDPAPNTLTGEQIATELLAFIRGPYDAAFSSMLPTQRPVLGFYLAGYSPGQHVASEWEFIFPTDERPHQPRQDNQYGASWRGVVMPFSRLYFGIDPRLIGMLAEQGVAADIIEKIQNAGKTLQSQIAFDGMPLQDAIGFCRFILDATIQQSTYEIGVPVCGGPIHVAIITRREETPFEWISQPRYS